MARSDLKRARRSYAEVLRVTAPVRNNQAVIEAFASVPRERFLGQGPWLIGANFQEYRTPDKQPRWLYHDVLIGIDTPKKINNGSPCLWAYLLDQLDLRPGERVLQVGAGTGYYTAILATLVGKQGRVCAVEYEKHLAARARANLRPWPQVQLVCGDASTFNPGEVDVVVVFAGGTHPAPVWLDCLARRGRLLMPLVSDDARGFVLKVVRSRGGFRAKAICRCWFVLAKGFRNKHEARDLKKTIAALNGKMPALGGLHRGRAPRSRKARAFFIGQDFWLSKRQ